MQGVHGWGEFWGREVVWTWVGGSSGDGGEPGRAGEFRREGGRACLVLLFNL